MFRQLRRSPTTRLAAITVSAGLLTAVGLAATAGPAAADSVINVHYALTGTTFIKKLNTTVNLGSGTLAASVDLTTGTSSSTLSLPPATVSVNELGLIPVSATTEMIQNGPATGTVNLTANTITSTANVTLKITKLIVAGLNLPVGNSCETTPFNISISSGAGFTVAGGGPVSGTYTIPPFHHCFLNTLLLNLTIPGPGNTLDLTLGALQIG
ncbi:MAG TPA: hypothetical protein VF070_31825 [Streptosporangiaceae bacterium]